MRFPLLSAWVVASCCVTAAMAAESAVAPMHSMDGLIGHWQCHGVFPASGKTIDSSMRFEPDLGGDAVLKHHDDVAPARYRAVEAWAYDAKAQRYNATVLDNFGGARRFSSEGWVQDTLTWTSSPDVQPAQSFVYLRKGTDLQVDWQVMKEGHFVVGDTLTCKRQ
ncbi:hypothetical protein SAMN05216570_2602 [Dyella sp. OK004]|uniref:hypothetical protein n=1 Tax=Dyella sp. OK004 TaxID=1855292 RepID=UPI0008DED3D3|nr:hypothetical protein [Dyella sp. OK004]SFS12035.1 hypothetical protein SAMN05216570_2602 [Dyella sp. OK004]